MTAAEMTGQPGELGDLLLEDLLNDVVTTDEQLGQTVALLIGNALGTPITREQILSKDWPALRDSIGRQIIRLLDAGLPEESMVRLALLTVEEAMTNGADVERRNKSAAFTRQAVERALNDEQELADFAAKLPTPRTLPEVRAQLQRMLEEGKLAVEVDADAAAQAWRYRELWRDLRERHLSDEVIHTWAIRNLQHKQ